MTNRYLPFTNVARGISDLGGEAKDFVSGIASAQTLAPEGTSKSKGNEAQYRQWAAESAQRWGVPESLLVGIITHESSWNPKAVNKQSGAAGLGQFLPGTATEYNTTVDQLLNDPKLAIDKAAEYLHNVAAPYAGEPDQWQKAAAGYVLPGAVALASKRSGDNWLQDADQQFQQYDQGSLVDYLSAVGYGGRDLAEASAQRQLGGYSKSRTGTLGPPDINDPIYNQNGTTDYATWSQDTQDYYQAQSAKRNYQLGPDMQYYDDLIAEIGQKISAGQLDLTKASTLLNARINSYQNAINAYNTPAFSYGANPGDAYFPGMEPGGFDQTVLGMTPRSTQGISSIDPMAEAQSTYSDAQRMIDSIMTPTVPNIAQGRLAAANAYNTPPATTAPNNPPPPAPPAPNTALTGALNDYRQATPSIIPGWPTFQKPPGAERFS